MYYDGEGRIIAQTSVHNRPLFQTTIIPSLSSDKLRPRKMRVSETLHNQHFGLAKLTTMASDRVLDYA